MKKLLLLQTVFLLSFSFISPSIGQSTDNLTRAYRFIEDTYGLDNNSVGELKIKSQYLTDHNQVEHILLVQTYRDLEILGSEINLAFLPNGRISCVGHHLVRMEKATFSKARVSIEAPEAIVMAANSLGVTNRSVPRFKKVMENGIPVYDKSDISLQDIPAELVYLHIDGEYKPVFKMLIESAQHGTMYQSYVDASSGKSIANDVLTLKCEFDDAYLTHEETCTESHNKTVSAPALLTGSGGQYRALPVGVESPSHGNFDLLSGMEDAQASPYGWHDINGVDGPEYTITRGNNVHAYLDRNWDYSPDNNLDGGSNLIFDFPYDENAEPGGNSNLAVTNLFYWNNIMHDFAYQYGFNEVAGNFQERNYSGLGGSEDYVEAHAQFGDDNTIDCGTETGAANGCVNNAYFSPPPDGVNGRMVMYTWDRDNSSKFLDIIEPGELSGKILTGAAQFGPTISTTPVTAEVVEYDVLTFNGTKACNTLTGTPLAGKIALIDRGLCDFSYKVYNAQRAGAIGAIICNFEEATIPMGTGENGAQVTIPSVFISSGECARIRIAVGNGLVASLVSPGSGGPARRDGSLDNSVIAHEYGHGISTRLTGGPSNSGCLSPNAVIGAAEESYGMGEGWSDFFALATTAQPGDTGAKRRGIGTYANKEPTNGRGIRTYPYSTDMSINPHTYDNILLEGLPHGVGSVWCAMLWDVYWAFVDAYGFDPDVYHGTGGNNIAIQLVMDGLKIQLCNPGFIESRNAILEADMINNDGANQCLIWGAFARRGLGFNVDGGDPDSRSDGKEGFDLPIACLNEISFSKTQTPEVVAGENIEVTLKVINYENFPLTNVVIEDPVPAGCTYLVGSSNIEPAVGNSLVWTINSLQPDEQLTITYLLKTDQAKPSIRMHYDDIEGFPEERWDIDFDPNGTSTNFWFQQDLIVKSGVSAWSVGNVATESQHFLQNYQPYTISGDYPLYRFYHYFNTETGADGGFLEISTDGGNIWITLESEVFRNGYPRKLQYTTFAIPNLFAFSGLSSPDLTMIPVYVDLREYIGEQVKIRYRFGTDENTPGDGWYVDDVEIMDAVIYNSVACVISNESEQICATAPSRGTIVDTQITISTEDDDQGTAFTLMPNPAGDLIQIVVSAAKSDQASLKLYNMTGHLVSSSTWNLAEGINQKTLYVSSFVPGMYIVQVKTIEGTRSEKFIKE